ncbi:MAG TPA: hypothetical protein VGP36_11580 [Mycobacteriales bacterium]|nr:hypothetical protein [Mycobacteriales bacterium]
MVDMLVPQTMVQVAVVLFGAIATCLFATGYLRRVRLERPAVGTFNGRDVVVLFVFIVALPMLYLILPHWALTSFLVITFVASLSIGYRPVVAPAPLWAGIGLLLGANIWIARTSLGTVGGWQVYWAETSVIVLLGASAVANLYVQGGMRLRHVAWFALFLAFYDFTFSQLIPLTPLLADAFIGYPLDPSIGMRLGIYNANIGIGDLLVYALFTIAALKAYGRRAWRVALAVVIVFGSLGPGLAPLVLDAVTRGSNNFVVPAQTFFGIPAFLVYLWMRRRWGPERTVQEFLASADVRSPINQPEEQAPAPAPVPEPAPAG